MTVNITQSEWAAMWELGHPRIFVNVSGCRASILMLESEDPKTGRTNIAQNAAKLIKKSCFVLSFLYINDYNIYEGTKKNGHHHHVKATIRATGSPELSHRTTGPHYNC